jgi:hypothetical protein
MSAGGKVVSDDGFFLSRPTSDPFCMNGYEFATAQSRREEWILARAKTNSRWAHGQAGNSNSPNFRSGKSPDYRKFPNS